MNRNCFFATILFLGLLICFVPGVSPSSAQERPDPRSILEAFHQGQETQDDSPFSTQQCAVAVEYFALALTKNVPEVIALRDEYDFDLAQTLWQHYAMFGMTWSDRERGEYDAALGQQNSEIQAGGLAVIYRNLGKCFLAEDQRMLPVEPLPLVNNYMVGAGRLPPQAGIPTDGRIKLFRAYDSNVVPIVPKETEQDLIGQCRSAGGVPLSIDELKDPSVNPGGTTGDPFQKVYDLQCFQPQ